jgi:hypothetical protein
MPQLGAGLGSWRVSFMSGLLGLPGALGVCCCTGKLLAMTPDQQHPSTQSQPGAGPGMGGGQQQTCRRQVHSPAHPAAGVWQGGGLEKPASCWLQRWGAEAGGCGMAASAPAAQQQSATPGPPCGAQCPGCVGAAHFRLVCVVCTRLFAGHVLYSSYACRYPAASCMYSCAWQGLQMRPAGDLFSGSEGTGHHTARHQPPRAVMWQLGDPSGLHGRASACCVLATPGTASCDMLCRLCVECWDVLAVCRGKADRCRVRASRECCC